MNLVDPDGESTINILGFGSYIRILNFSWRNVLIHINLTYGGLINLGIGIAAGISGSLIAAKLVPIVLAKLKILTIPGLSVAFTKITKSITKQLSSKTFSTIGRRSSGLRTTAWFFRIDKTW